MAADSLTCKYHFKTTDIFVIFKFIFQFKLIMNEKRKSTAQIHEYAFNYRYEKINCDTYTPTTGLFSFN